MIALLSLFTGGVGKYAIYAAVAVALVAGLATVWHVHNTDIANAQKALDQAAILKATTDAQIARLNATIAGMQREAAEQASIINQGSKIIKVIHDAPVTKACIASPSVSTAIRLLNPATDTGSKQ